MKTKLLFKVRPSLSLLIAIAFVIPAPALALDPPKPLPEMTTAERETFKEMEKKWLEKTSPAELPKPEPVTVKRVIDGDTFKTNSRTVRIWGIDAPEKDEPVSLAATLYLETILEGGDVTCKFIEQDRYQRDVMQCFSNGEDIGSMMVLMGMAKAYKRYSGSYYEYEETLARNAKRGIWQRQLN